MSNEITIAIDQSDLIFYVMNFTTDVVLQSAGQSHDVTALAGTRRPKQQISTTVRNAAVYVPIAAG